MLLDVNILLYAVNAADPRHRVVRPWLELRLAGSGAVGFAWLALLAFLRIATGTRFSAPLSTSTALDLVEEWLAAPAALVVEPTARHLFVLRELLESSGRAGDIVPDAHLAALAVEHGMSLATFDTDFRRFQGLRVVVPAAQSS